MIAFLVVDLSRVLVMGMAAAVESAKSLNPLSLMRNLIMSLEMH
jgi:hypothetical protein